MKLFQHVDALLRGSYTDPEDLRAGRIPVSARALGRVALVLGVVYGAFMGLYGVLRPENASVSQLVATSVKVPLLFLLTLAVTYPSLYVFSALARSRLRAHDTLRMLLVAVSVNLALLASLGPVTGFFTLSTESYPFMVLLNVVFFGVAGFVGLRFLGGALDSVFSVGPATAEGETSDAADTVAATGAEDADGTKDEPAADAASPAPDETPPPAPAYGGTWRGPRAAPLVTAQTRRDDPAGDASAPARRVFVIWTFIYAVVGAQMGWILRPFIGSPGRAFEWFRERDSHFFEALVDTIARLFS